MLVLSRHCPRAKHSLATAERFHLGNTNALNVEASPASSRGVGESLMGGGLHSVRNASHTSEFSTRPHLSVASRRASADSGYLPSTSFHDEHANLFFAIDHASSTSFRSALPPAVFNIQPQPLQVRLIWLAVLMRSMLFPSPLQVRAQRLEQSERWYI